MDSRMQLRIMSFVEFQQETKRAASDEPSVVDLINAGLVALEGAVAKHGLDLEGAKAVESMHDKLSAMGPGTDRKEVLKIHDAIKRLDVPIASWAYRSPDDAGDLKEAYEAYVSSMKAANAMLHKK